MSGISPPEPASDVEAWLQVTEVLPTIGGEASLAGWPCVLVRLTGCPLRCSYCDSAHAFQGGRRITLGALLSEVRRHGLGRVLVTGGEPLAQKHCLALLRALLEAGYEVHLETSGAFPVAAVPAAVHRVIDIKLTSSGEQQRMCWANLDELRPSDELKFVIAGEADLRQAIALAQEHRLDRRCTLLLSPVWGRLDPLWLAREMLRSSIAFKLNLQLHKLAFGPGGDDALQESRSPSPLD